MHRRAAALRFVVTLATFVVAWLVAHPAMASTQTQRAPVCDPRGAIMFAPPPQLQDPEQSLDIVTNDDDCTESPLENRHVVPRHGPQADPPAASQDSATAVPPIVCARPAAEQLPAPDASEVQARSGIRNAVDRPPRA